MTWAWENGPEDPVSMSVLVKLADNADHQGCCFPSMREISERTRYSESTVRRSLNDLEKGGWLTAIKGCGRGNNSQYQLLKRVSEKNLSERKLSQKKLSVGPKKGVTVTEKGVTVTNPPDPLIGVTVINRQEPSLPEWLPRDCWVAFVEMRKKIKSPLTDHAKDLAIRKLDEFRKQGHSPRDILENSIIGNYQGLFIPRQNGNGGGNGHHEGKYERIQRETLELMAREEAHGFEPRPPGKR